MHSIKNRGWALMNTIVFIILIVTNYLAVSLPLNGKTTGQLSDAYPNLFTPAGITFSIWGLIYLFLTIFVVYQAVSLRVNSPVADSIKSISPYFIINSIANASWLFAWHYQQLALSVCIMLVMLYTLIVIHNKLYLPLTWSDVRQKLCLDTPFSLYLGWISIATIANITVLLVDNNIQPLNISPATWTIIMIAVAALLSVTVLLVKRNIVFALVICWALYGIIIKRTHARDEQHIISACQVALGVIGTGILLTLLYRRKAAKKVIVR